MISLIVLAVCLLVAQTGDTNTNELRRLVSVQQWEEQCYDDLVSHCLLVVMPSYAAAEAMKAVEKVANSGENPSFQYFWTAQGDHSAFQQKFHLVIEQPVIIVIRPVDRAYIIMKQHITLENLRQFIAEAKGEREVATRYGHYDQLPFRDVDDPNDISVSEYRDSQIHPGFDYNQDEL